MIWLTAEQCVDERPFTHPAYSEIDRRQLRYMLLRLCHILEAFHWRPNPNAERPLVQDFVESDGRHHRVIVLRPHAFVDRQHFSIVGFFGQRRFDADVAEAASRDKMLFEEMAGHPGLLSYTSLEMTNGDYGNCVVFADEGAKNAWGRSPTHQSAVADLSPRFYHSVRLYNGILDGTIMENNRLRLTVVKYLDYRESPPWFAQRRL